jgi:hypothetical protein
MIRLAWLQARAQNLAALGGLVIVAAALALTGPHLVHLYDTTVANCAAQGDCDTATHAFLRHDDQLRTWLGGLIIAFPAIIGIFWGAPLLARELESGTYRLVWTQSVSRSRWLAVKLGAIGLASLTIVGLLSLIVTWWASPLDRAHATRFTTFDQRDIVPIGYAAFAFALGVTAGLLIRRTLPAMAIALAAFVAVRLAIYEFLRAHLLASAHTGLPVTAGQPVGFGPGPSGLTFTSGTVTIPNAWVLSSRIVDKAGRVASPASLHEFLQANCPLVVAHREPSRAQFRASADKCVSEISAKFHLAVTYQPASHYWPLQWLELAMFVAFAGILVGLCFWWVRRRRYA